MVTKRCHQVAGLLKSEIGDIIQTRLKDPLIGFVTITDVIVSGDLKQAKVYFSVLGSEDQKKDSLRGLERARTHIQTELGHRVRLRYLPILHFYLDESWETRARIDRLLHDLELDGLPTAE